MIYRLNFALATTTAASVLAVQLVLLTLLRGVSG